MAGEQFRRHSLGSLATAGAAIILTAACGGGAATQAPAALPSGLLTHVEVTPITGKTASIDILVIDQGAHLLYAADRTDSGVDVIDISQPQARYLRTLDTGSPPNGIVLVKDQNKLFAADNDSTVAVLDLKTGKIVDRVNTGGKKRADELDYDPKDKKVYVANSDDGIVSVIDATSDKLVKQFKDVSAGGLEQPRYDPADGMIYLTLSDENAIVQFDPDKDVMVKRWSVGQPCGPQGIAINPKTNQALLGCGNKKTESAVLWDLAAGKAISTFDDAGAGDVTLYDAKADRFFFAASNFTKGGLNQPLLAIFTGSPPVRFLAAQPTAAGSHSVAYDETNKVVYLQDQEENHGGLFAFPLTK